MNYTTSQYIKELDRRLGEIKRSNLVYLSALVIHPEYINRIFDKGLNAFNSPHGTYSTKPIYVNTKRKSPKAVKSVGKTGNSVFKSGKPHKTTYFPRGYSQFKQSIGRGSAVNFRLFDDLKLDMTNGLRKLKDKAQVILKRNFNVKKVNGLIEKYGKDSFMFSERERQKYLNDLAKRLNKIMGND